MGVGGVVTRSVLDLLATYRERHAVEFTALAMPSVYGPRQRPEAGVVAAFAAALRDGSAPTVHGDGRQTRDFLSAVQKSGKPVQFLLAEGYNHFDLQEMASNPYSVLGSAALDMMELNSPDNRT